MANNNQPAPMGSDTTGRNDGKWQVLHSSLINLAP